MQFDLSASNPFAILTFIAAPAILTNASSVMSMQTSNRFARAVDRARQLSTQIPDRKIVGEADYAMHLQLLDLSERRMLLLVRALTCFYLAVGSFAAAAFASLLGAGFHLFHLEPARFVALAVGLITGCTGVGGMLIGSSVLVWETRRTLEVMIMQTRFLRDQRALRTAQQEP